MLPSNNQPSTSTADSTSDSKSNSYQVLNISNVNAQKEIVLNDEQLLGLIQLYPYLYNPHVKPHKDPHFDKYAWEQITKSFNRSYESIDRNVRYTTSELQARWDVLQPIVRSLSKISNIKSLPDSLRQTVIKMSIPMHEQVTTEIPKKVITEAQETILTNIEMVEKLPLEHRRRLEAEMMELILNCELDSKATVKLLPLDQRKIEKEYYDFLNAAGLQEVHESDDESNTPQQPLPNISHNNNILNNGHDLAHNTPIIPIQLDIKSEHSDSDDFGLLQPLPSKRWIPLSCWTHYVRKCRVRIKRSNLQAMMKEDELPLARIKREKFGV